MRRATRFLVVLKHALKNWLQLLRVPNLFTVPGDPLAGFLLASGGEFVASRAFLAIGASLCFYSSGLLLNDLADLDEDRRERPDRPLPSGAVRPAAVWVATVGLFVLGLSLCAIHGTMLLPGVALFAAIVGYNLWLKKFPLIGPLTMAACRGLSVLLGAAACLPLAQLHSSPGALVAALATTVYIFAVAMFARRETADPRIPPLIGSLLRGLLFLQAAFCLASRSAAGIIAALALIALWPLSRALGKRFYAS